MKDLQMWVFRFLKRLEERLEVAQALSVLLSNRLDFSLEISDRFIRALACSSREPRKILGGDHGQAAAAKTRVRPPPGPTDLAPSDLRAV
jgi:hypothetical protein